MLKNKASHFLHWCVFSTTSHKENQFLYLLSIMYLHQVLVYLIHLYHRLPLLFKNFKKHVTLLPMGHVFIHYKTVLKQQYVLAAHESLKQTTPIHLTMPLPLLLCSSTICYTVTFHKTPQVSFKKCIYTTICEWRKFSEERLGGSRLDSPLVEKQQVTWLTGQQTNSEKMTV